MRAVIAEAPHVLYEDLSVRSIRKAREDFLSGDLRARLLRHHGDNVDCAFWGWNRAWLDPEFMRWNIEEYLPRISVPVLVIQGEDDEYGTEAQWRSIEGKCPGPVEVSVLSSCGHSPHRDQPEATLEALLRFVGRRGPFR